MRFRLRKKKLKFFEKHFVFVKVYQRVLHENNNSLLAYYLFFIVRKVSFESHERVFDFLKIVSDTPSPFFRVRSANLIVISTLKKLRLNDGLLFFVHIEKINMA
jgi:hypothetical protein